MKFGTILMIRFETMLFMRFRTMLMRFRKMCRIVVIYVVTEDLPACFSLGLSPLSVLALSPLLTQRLTRGLVVVFVVVVMVIVVISRQLLLLFIIIFAFIHCGPSLADQLESHHALSPFFVYLVFACLARPDVIFQSCL